MLGILGELTFSDQGACSLPVLISTSKSNKIFYESVRTPQDLMMIWYTRIYLSVEGER